MSSSTMSLLVLSALASLSMAAPMTVAAAYESTNVTIDTRGDAPFGDKKGLAYTVGLNTDILSRPNSATWAYNWGTALAAPKFQQIPMYWGPGSGDDAPSIFNKIAMGDTPWVLGYNEPDMDGSHGGCFQTPKQAYDAWGNDMFRFQVKGPKLVCPAITSYNTANSMFTGFQSGLTWLRSFARDFRPDLGPGQFRCSAQALHWYGTQGDSAQAQAQAFIDYIAYAHGQVDDIFQTTNMEIWVTEFAPLPLGDANIMSDFLRITIPWLDAQPWIGRYAPFIANSLVDGDNLNVAGQTFVNTN